MVYSGSQWSGWMSPSGEGGPLAMHLAIAEPLEEDLLAGDFVFPDGERNAVNEAVAYQEPLLPGIVTDSVGQLVRLVRDRSVFRDGGRNSNRKTRRGSRPSMLGINHSVAAGFDSFALAVTPKFEIAVSIDGFIGAGQVAL